MDITKYAILKKLAGGGGGGGDHTTEDAFVEKTLTEYTNDRVTKIASYAFYNCFKLTSVNFPIATLMDMSVFQGCDSLVSVSLPMITRVSNSAFRGCSALTSIKLPSATYIASYTFYNCSKLTSVDLPAATTICAGVFSDTKITSLILRNTTEVCDLTSSDSFNSTPVISGTGYIYVPAALINSYKTATNWTKYANRFRALESYTVDGTTTGELDPTKVNA